jgi:preprotein translocase subunit SecF
MEFIKPGRQFDFMSRRRLFVGISLVAMALSVVTLFVPGLKFGTDFLGGTEVELAFKQHVEAGDVREVVEGLGFESPDVVAVTDLSEENHFLIRVQEVSALSEDQKAKINDRLCHVPEGQPVPEDRCPPNIRASEVKFSPGGDKISVRYEVTPDVAGIAGQLKGLEGIELTTTGTNPMLVSERDNKVEIRLKSKGDQLLDGLRDKLGADKVPEQALRVEWIGPKAGAQLRDAAIKSIAIAIVFIMAYVAFRFDIRFAPGGIFALLHDVLIALGAMAITQREITLSTVAALLTIVGFSITDTVVVYDRIRENLGMHRSMSFSQIINLSISEMLGRTLITQLVTSLSMLCFLFWGTGTIKDFAFAMLVGFVVGAYSSIYVAAPITEFIDRRFFGASASQHKKITRTRATKRADAVV